MVFLAVGCSVFQVALDLASCLPDVLPSRCRNAAQGSNNCRGKHGTRRRSDKNTKAARNYYNVIRFRPQGAIQEYVFSRSLAE
jgi:hypothetical protein